MNNNAHINQTLQGYYKVGVVHPETNEVEWKAEGKNLILNQGMDNLYNLSVADQMVYGVCGVGTRPNSLTSGTSTVSQSVNTVFLSDKSGNVTDFTSSFDVYTATAQVGDMLVYSNGSQSMITAVNSNGVNLTVTPSLTFSPGQTFVLWKTSQVGLQTEISRSNSYLVGTGNCGTTVSATGSISYQRTYDFPIIQSQLSYNEIGVGWASSGATTIFSRVLISPIIVFAGFRLRIVYQLQTQWSPTGSIFGAASIGGWPVVPSTTTNGTQSAQVFLTSTIDTNGNSGNLVAALDPYWVGAGSNILATWASTNSKSLASFGNAIDRTLNSSYAVSGQMSKAAYTNGQYFVDKTGNITAGSLSSNSIRSIGFGVGGGSHTPPNSVDQAFCFVFDQPQTVFNTQTLSTTYRQSWSRTLA